MADLYRHFDERGTLLYVGVSFGAIARLQGHRDSCWVDNISRVEIEKFDTMAEAKRAEKIAITNERPAHNITYNTGPYVPKPTRQAQKPRERADHPTRYEMVCGRVAEWFSALSPEDRDEVRNWRA